MGWHPTTWRLRSTTLSTQDHSLVMGVLNVTPDSFSDGGRFAIGFGVDRAAAVEAGLAMWAAGADIVDVGGESSRPGARPVDDAVEAERVVPIVAELAAAGVVVSIDTSKAPVAAAALDAGAEIVNDVTALGDPDMAAVCSRRGAGLVLMHMRGEPRTMQDAPHYDDVVGEVRDFLLGRADVARAAGIDGARICLDPGIGFGKNVEHNLALLHSAAELVSIGYPILIGASRKSTLGAVLAAHGIETAAVDRDPATAATTALAIAAGAAVVRVHDVASTVQVARMADAIVRATRHNRNDGTM